MLSSDSSYQYTQHRGSDLAMALSAVFHDVSTTAFCLWNVRDLELYFLGQKKYLMLTHHKPKTNYGPGPIRVPPSFFVRPAELEEMMLVVIK